MKFCFSVLLLAVFFPHGRPGTQLHSVFRAWTILILTFFVARTPSEAGKLGICGAMSDPEK